MIPFPGSAFSLLPPTEARQPFIPHKDIIMRRKEEIL